MFQETDGGQWRWAFSGKRLDPSISNWAKGEEAKSKRKKKRKNARRVAFIDKVSPDKNSPDYGKWRTADRDGTAHYVICEKFAKP